jgi:hypothetical protein
MLSYSAFLVDGFGKITTPAAQAQLLTNFVHSLLNTQLK